METTLKIQHLKCGGCANTIINKLGALSYISEIDVDNMNDTLSFQYFKADDLIEIKNVLAKLGYPIVGEKNAFATKAKSFVSCAVGRMSN